MLRVLLLFFLLLISFSQCDINCYSCYPLYNVCKTCYQGFQLVDGLCVKLSISNGAVAGIVIGCLVIGGLVVFAMLCLIVRCSETVEQRQQIVETVLADTYYLPSSSNGMIISASNSAIMTPSIYQRNPNMQLQHNFPITQLQKISIQAQSNFKQISKNNINNQISCTICLQKNTNLQLIPCGHTFHYKCLIMWTNRYNFCPNCHIKYSTTLITCQQCGNFNQTISFCGTQCQNINHEQCFLKRNKNKLICRNCSAFARTKKYPTTFKQ